MKKQRNTEMYRKKKKDRQKETKNKKTKKAINK